MKRAMDIATLANLASTLAVIVGVAFGLIQVRHMAKTRALFQGAELVRAMQNAEFARSVPLVLALPDEADPTLVDGDIHTAAAVLSLSHVYESLGVLVYHRIIPLHLVDDLMGGYIRKSWRKVKPYVEMRRGLLGVYYGEWMQWLVERLEEHPSLGKSRGAHIAHRDWVP